MDWLFSFGRCKRDVDSSEVKPAGSGFRVSRVRVVAMTFEHAVMSLMLTFLHPLRYRFMYAENENLVDRYCQQDIWRSSCAEQGALNQTMNEKRKSDQACAALQTTRGFDI